MNGVRLLACVGAVLCACSSGLVDSTGGASETVNAYVSVASLTVSISLENTHGGWVSAYLVSAGYDPGYRSGSLYSLACTGEQDLELTADSAGIYNLYIIDDSASSGVLLADIVLADSVRDTLLDSLAPLASVAGAVVVPDSAGWWPESTTVMAVGAPFITWTDSLRQFAFDRLPAGAYTLLARPATESAAERTTRQVSRELTLTSGEDIQGITLYFSN